MNVSDNCRILNQMINVVLRQLDEEKLELREDSFFAEELRNIPEMKRRELMETYLRDKTFLLLHGIMDQVHSLNSMLNVPSPAVVEVSPYILARTMLEYLSKLAYLTDPQTSERIPRTLRCLYADLQESSKRPYFTDWKKVGRRSMQNRYGMVPRIDKRREENPGSQNVGDI